MREVISLGTKQYEYSATDFDHVLWLGGSPCAGKSSIAEMLRAKYSVDVYHVDDAFQEHMHTFTPEKYPTCYKWTHTPWDSLWMQTQQTLLEEAISAYTEHIQFIMDDLYTLRLPVVAEGTSLLPHIIRNFITKESDALWLVPVEEFQREMYPKRDQFVNFILQQCANPQLAFKNWMDRDVAFASWTIEQTKELKLRCVEVNNQYSSEYYAEVVAKHFQLQN
jgi:2-phosphoglycerate kinase